MIFPTGSVKRISVNKANVRAGLAAIWDVRVNGGKYTVNAVAINGLARTVYSPNAPLMPEGTYAWIETNAGVSTVP